VYCTKNFPTKAALIEAVERGMKVSIFQPGSFSNEPTSGEVSIEGPHSPKPHTWSARVTLRNSLIVEVE